MSRLRLAQLVSLATCALGALAPRPCHAQNPAAAEALFEQARSAMAAGSFDIACARFRDSDKLDPAVGTRFNLADCEERRGRVATAWSIFRGVLSELPQDDDRRPIAEGRAKALEPRLPYLTMLRRAETPPGMRVRIDGVELGEASFGVPLPMDPGAHDLALLAAEGGKEQRSTFVLKEGHRTNLPIRFSAPTPAPVATAGSVEQPEPAAAGAAADADASGSRRTWAYVAGGVGAAGVAVGAVTGILTLGKKSTANANCDDRTKVCNEVGMDANRAGKKLGLASGVSFGVGVVGLATSALLLLTAPEEKRQAAHPSIRVRSGVSVNPQFIWENSGGFVSLAGSF